MSLSSQCLLEKSRVFLLENVDSLTISQATFKVTLIGSSLIAACLIYYPNSFLMTWQLFLCSLLMSLSQYNYLLSLSMS